MDVCASSASFSKCDMWPQLFALFLVVFLGCVMQSKMTRELGPTGRLQHLHWIYDMRRFGRRQPARKPVAGHVCGIGNKYSQR